MQKLSKVEFIAQELINKIAAVKMANDMLGQGTYGWEREKKLEEMRDDNIDLAACCCLELSEEMSRISDQLTDKDY